MTSIQPVKKEDREGSFAYKHDLFDGVHPKHIVDVVDVVKTDEAIEQNENSGPIPPTPKEPQDDVTGPDGECENRHEKEHGESRLVRCWFQQNRVSENVENGHQPS